jgi:RHS repeat-associated protein
MYSPTGQKLGAYKLNPAINGSFEPFMIVTLVSSDQFFGSRRLAVMDQLGSVGTYYPWGENRGSTKPQDTWSFGTYWTDSVTGLDYANNRYYFNSLGRFVTPDPAGAGAASGQDPVSWNRYAYTGGDPVNRNDPSGTCDITTFSTNPETGAIAVNCIDFGGGSINGASDLGGPGVDGNGGVAHWNDPVGQKTVIPTVIKSYPLATQCHSTAQQLIQTLEFNFAAFANFSRTVAGVTESVTFKPPSGPLTVGESIPITVQVGGSAGYTLNTSVTVTAVTSNSFTFQTVPGHILYPATITFIDTSLGSGDLSFDVNLSGTVPGFWAAFFWKTGGDAFEDAQWNNLLQNVSLFCDGSVIP